MVGVEVQSTGSKEVIRFLMYSQLREVGTDRDKLFRHSATPQEDPVDLVAVRVIWVVLEELRHRDTGVVAPT